MRVNLEDLENDAAFSAVADIAHLVAEPEWSPNTLDAINDVLRAHGVLQDTKPYTVIGVCMRATGYHRWAETFTAVDPADAELQALEKFGGVVVGMIEGDHRCVDADPLVEIEENQR